MSFAPIDVHFDEHPKFAQLELEHFGLMACALAYCNRVLSDGFVPDKTVRGFGASTKNIKAAERLVVDGIWIRVDGGYRIVGYLEHNLSKADIEERRKAKVEAGAKGGRTRSKSEARAQADAQARARASASESAQADAKLYKDSNVNLPTGEERRTTLSLVDEPKSPKAPREPRATRIPDDFEPKPETVAALVTEGYADPLRVLNKFRDHWRAQSGARGVKADWEATFRNWVRNERVPPGNRSGTFGRVVQSSQTDFSDFDNAGTPR